LQSKEAEKNNVEYFSAFDMIDFLQGLDVVVISVPMVELEETIESLPLDKLRNKLIVDICPLNAYPRTLLTRMLPQETDILCTNPMFGPGLPLDGVPFVYEKVRISDSRRANCFLSTFERARCQMIEMACEDHDDYVADAEFVTHLTGRLLNRNLLPVSFLMLRDILVRLLGQEYLPVSRGELSSDQFFLDEYLIDVFIDSICSLGRVMAKTF
jgi:prephenate dehydrogenase